MSRPVISESEQKFIIEGCQDNCRQDGRSRFEFRPYLTVIGNSSDVELPQQPPLALSNGSARVFLATGETNVMVSVKAELVEPALSLPDRGVIEVHVDRMEKRDEELEATISNLLLPHLVDTQKLCVVPQYFVWRLHLDLLILSTDGGSLVDACSRGIHAALQNTHLPNIAQVPAAQEGDKPTLQVDSDIKSACAIAGVDKAPVIVTVSMLKSAKNRPILILDANSSEEACAYAQVHVVLDYASEEKPTVCALYKAGGGSLPFALLQDITAFAAEAAWSSRSVSHESHHHMLQEPFVVQQ